MTKPLLLSLLCAPDPERPDPLAVQLYHDLLAAIRDGRLDGGARLPSSRRAAEELAVSRSTVNTAYDLLRAEGVVAIRQGAAPEVLPAQQPTARPAVTATRTVSERGARLAETPRRSGGSMMAPGQPSEAAFPADDWARQLRRVARRVQGPAFAYGETDGLPALRSILAERLGTDRGLKVDPDQILITPGTQASLALVSHVMADPGDLAALEDPCHLGARIAFGGAGLTPHPVPVDRHGIDPQEVPAAARLLYLTPSNQYPMGVRLTRPHRLALLDWAARSGGTILEDDYDSEFHWRGKEIAALASEARGDEVIYLGSASKALAPGLRLGWLVGPASLMDPLRRAQRNLGMLANIHAQGALAEMMRTGGYRAQLARIARIYEPRGRALAAALAVLPGVEAEPPDGGVQVAARFDDTWSEETAITALREAGFGPNPLSNHCQVVPLKGLVVGFADATPERIAQFIHILKAVRNLPNY
ncbi:PLP-dependent aminotransferase family protein [Palleronia caenipelagi]|uniref:PLP-dependent aminotransferase family protein n=1 Tax=Palleronia caenipelagi TaxID=2489174 RepID=A0A547PXQ9_9RHOB|nr:PLP-dependent aminotransferase family protein [Palleronia caenipelagi]TRD18894.1 PLP-dependent aminotransferase family protein [Palleronia caenipelagi]